MNQYEFQIRAKCPVHKNLVDIYDATITTDATIEVEKILEFCKQFGTKQIFQEALTLEIAVGLGVRVKTVGMHSGVKVTSIAP